MFKKIFSVIISKKGIVTINLVLVVLGLFFNRLSQGFCNPSFWSSILIGISLIFVIISPLVRDVKSHLVGFIAGVSFSSFLYCVIFLGHINLYALPLILVGIGIVILIPHFFAFQLIQRFFFKAKNKIVKKYFVIGVVSCFCVSILAGISYNNAANKIKKLQESNSLVFDTNFMTEKIVGMHFIYHTEICEYDGWRPPIHEPMLVLGLWWNSMADPLEISLEERLDLYRLIFPDNPVKFKCSCAIEESRRYHNDELWNK
ncbi:hypothetical protein N9P38_01050 [Flavobacteriales bacterium]|nr:hypothetical protein [Flavobacteriales bacterium]